jgi:hypothetical protein
VRHNRRWYGHDWHDKNLIKFDVLAVFVGSVIVDGQLPVDFVEGESFDLFHKLLELDLKGVHSCSS